MGEIHQDWFGDRKAIILASRAILDVGFGIKATRYVEAIQKHRGDERLDFARAGVEQRMLLTGASFVLGGFHPPYDCSVNPASRIWLTEVTRPALWQAAKLLGE